MKSCHPQGQMDRMLQEILKTSTGVHLGVELRNSIIHLICQLFSTPQCLKMVHVTFQWSPQDRKTIPTWKSMRMQWLQGLAHYQLTMVGCQSLLEMVTW